MVLTMNQWQFFDLTTFGSEIRLLSNIEIILLTVMCVLLIDFSITSIISQQSAVNLIIENWHLGYLNSLLEEKLQPKHAIECLQMSSKDGISFSDEKSNIQCDHARSRSIITTYSKKLFFLETLKLSISYVNSMYVITFYLYKSL